MAYQYPILQWDGDTHLTVWHIQLNILNSNVTYHSTVTYNYISTCFPCTNTKQYMATSSNFLKLCNFQNHTDLLKRCKHFTPSYKMMFITLILNLCYTNGSQAMLYMEVKYWWKKNIKINLTEKGWGSVNWVHLFQCMDWWQPLLNTVMKLQVAQEGNFTTWAILCLSGIMLLSWISLDILTPW